MNTEIETAVSMQQKEKYKKMNNKQIYIIIYSIGLAVFTSGTLFSSQSWLLADARKLSEVPQASQQAGSIYIPNIITRDLQGKQVDIKLTGTTKPTVIYIFESRCMWSASNYSNIKRLAEEVGDKYNFIGISLSDHKLENYIAAHPFQFPIFKTLLPTQHTKEVSLGVVPQTIVISRIGKTTKRWLGVYAGDVAREIEQFFRIKLPGLTVDGPPNAQPLNCSFALMIAVYYTHRAQKFSTGIGLRYVNLMVNGGKYSMCLWH